jgi:hypothetical protein
MDFFILIYKNDNLSVFCVFILPLSLSVVADILPLSLSVVADILPLSLSIFADPNQQ